jgi:hypothetical protein
MELEPVMRFVPWQLRITNEPEMSLVADLSEGVDQTVDATGKAASTGIRINTFKR